jgi:hypothetical protein
MAGEEFRRYADIPTFDSLRVPAKKDGERERA